ncbi:MAG TPA: hypothetical protein VN417_05830 [Candidatus Cryosericum sp.]|nr:hypothetical protein [Candidatus Cryosericum sp.]
MKFKEISPKLLLNFNEYADTWVKLVQEYYQRSVSNNQIYAALELNDEGAMRFTMEFVSVLLIIAMRAWGTKRFNKDETRSLVEDAVVEKAYRVIFAEDEETLSACKEFYAARYQMLNQLAPNNAKSEKAIRANLIGFARYVVSQCSDRAEEENAAVIEHMSVLLIAAAGSFKRLTDNSTIDPNTVFGKPKFIVQK